MNLLVKRYMLPKAGNTEAELEDACSINEPNDVPVQHFAVADGATASVFSKFWATILVNAYSNGQMLNGNMEKCLTELQDTWWQHACARAKAWYVREKIQQGAHATMIGLSLLEPESGSESPGAWNALAVGDACLFHLRSGSLLDAFPIASADGFSNSPALLSSVDPLGNLADDLRLCQGNWLPGDVFLLMTDAISCWFLSDLKDSMRLIEDLTDNEKDFRWLVDSLRSDKTDDGMPVMKNDDVTLMRIELT